MTNMTDEKPLNSDIDVEKQEAEKNSESDEFSEPLEKAKEKPPRKWCTNNDDYSCLKKMDHSEVYNVARESVGENNLNLMRQELVYVLC